MLQIALKNDEGFNGSISISDQKLKRFTCIKPRRISVVSKYSQERKNIEHFIENVFKDSYDAKIVKHYPALMSVYDEDDNILAAVGFRYAKDEELFLETYLDTPIEQALSNAYKRPINRDVISEIGNLASHGKGASIFLFTALNAYLKQQGMQINTVTATNFLQRYFKALGLKSKYLAKANQNKLADNGASWGSYYNQNPVVIAGELSQVLSSLEKHLKVVLESNQIDMKARIYQTEEIEEITYE